MILLLQFYIFNRNLKKNKKECQELHWIPNDTTSLETDAGKKVIRLIERIEEDDDVQNVFHNLEITPELEEMLQAE